MHCLPMEQVLIVLPSGIPHDQLPFDFNHNRLIDFDEQTNPMDEEIETIKEGKDIMIGFNPRFLIDALRVIDDEEITIYMINPKAPCFIRDKEESYIYLILPVNFNV